MVVGQLYQQRQWWRAEASRHVRIFVESIEVSERMFSSCHPQWLVSAVSHVGFFGMAMEMIFFFFVYFFCLH